MVVLKEVFDFLEFLDISILDSMADPDNTNDYLLAVQNTTLIPDDIYNQNFQISMNPSYNNSLSDEIIELPYRSESLPNRIDPDKLKSLPNRIDSDLYEEFPNRIDSDLSESLETELSQCQYRKYRTYEKLTHAFTQLNLNTLSLFDKYCKGYVYYSDLLNLFLSFHKDRRINLHIDHITNMLQRCLESVNDNMNDNIYVVNLLLNYVGDNSCFIKLKLLPNLYPINQYLYEYINKFGIHDEYYEAMFRKEYLLESIIIRKQRHDEITFRDINYLLLYGDSDDIQRIIVAWDIYGYDIMVQYVADFFKIPSNIKLVEEYLFRYSNRNIISSES